MFPFYSIEREVIIEGFYNAFDDRLSPDFVFRGESHNSYELLLVYEGSVGVTSGSDSFIVDAPAAVLHPPMTFHSIRAEKGTSPLIRVFEFKATSMPKYTHTLFTFSEEAQERGKRILEIVRSSAESFGMHILKTRSGFEKQMQKSVCELELLILSLDKGYSPATQLQNTKSLQNFIRVLNILKDNLTAPLSVTDIARLANISPSLLKKLFKRHTGMGVIEYFRQQKINAAIPLLKDGWNVSEASAHLGFSDPGYFSTVFKKVTGNPPTYYKNN